MSYKRIVGIVDYHAGNIQSIENAFFHLDAEVIRVVSEEQLLNCTHVVLPGVGAFGFCSDKLKLSGLIAHLENWAFVEHRPLLGICVGMQLMSDASDESAGVGGLGWLGGNVRRIFPKVGVRVPHVGWNTVHFERTYGDFLEGDSEDFYFDHSFAYHQPAHGETIGYCQHGSSFSAIIQHENIIATQFHPEKSQQAGLKFLTNFMK